VLQNDKYIAFANDNTVEVIALGELQDGIDKKDRRAELYDAKDEAGNPVKYMKEFAGMTVEQLLGLNSSPANSYNKTGHIPYVSIVDPFTTLEMKSMPGGAAAGGLMDAAKEAKDVLNKEHGPSVKRSVLLKIDAAGKSIDAMLTKEGVAKALPEYRKLETSLAKEPDSVKAKAVKIEEKILETAKTQLDDAEGKIAAGDLKAASAILTPLSRALKGTDLFARATELLAKAKPAAEPAK